MDSEDCHHVDRGDNTCQYCAQELGVNWERTLPPILTNIRVKSLWAELNSISAIPEEIRRRADEINQDLNFPTHRGNHRKRIILYCVYTAMKEFNFPMEPKVLCQLLKVKPSELASIPAMEMQMALRNKEAATRGTVLTISEASANGLGPGKMSIQLNNVLDILPTMAKRVGLLTIDGDDSQISSLMTLSKQVLAENPKLNQLAPLNLAAALIYYYLVMRTGQEVNISLLSDRTGVTVNNIQAAFREVSA